MLFAVGTTNPCKIAAVQNALAGYSAFAAAEIKGTKVESGVSDQPMTMEETSQGARNRARAARKALEGASFGIGMESGLFKMEGRLYDVCACAVDDGEEFHIGYSCAWELPDGVRRRVEDENMNLTDAFNAEGICDDPNIGDKGGVISLLSGGRVSRTDYTVQSIQMAVLKMNPAFYTCSGSVAKGINDPPKA
eukprot:TRINITY_DN64395_c0_g1_i1.p1 TRINITY_DN64395_c0_g1~~TRINITY_DN64395_c0_g1_i1.p1  ORF type:complete len:193 (-),score=39.38 TRINITY_DN64395_c0_g1_i1:536-1114(-)